MSGAVTARTTTRRAFVAAWVAAFVVCAACGGKTDEDTSFDDDPSKKCFWSDQRLRGAFTRSGSGIYGTTAVTSCAAHCPPEFRPFCSDRALKLVATSRSGVVISAVPHDGAYSLALAPGVYDVCNYTDRPCVWVNLAPGEYRRIDAEAPTSPGGGSWMLRLR